MSCESCDDYVEVETLKIIECFKRRQYHGAFSMEAVLFGWHMCLQLFLLNKKLYKCLVLAVLLTHWCQLRMSFGIGNLSKTPAATPALIHQWLKL